jgi:hypothetical protein
MIARRCSLTLVALLLIAALPAVAGDAPAQTAPAAPAVAAPTPAPAAAPALCAATPAATSILELQPFAGGQPLCTHTCPAGQLYDCLCMVCHGRCGEGENWNTAPTCGCAPI